jgi:hypothetical protein
MDILKSGICLKVKYAVNIIKEDKSSARFGRIADNIRDKYIITIIENINKLSQKSNWIFGSKNIIDDIYEKKIISQLN